MSNKPYTAVSSKLSQRVAEEAQLLSEEKWLIEALTEIKNQRNAIQIERLHLESLKAKSKSECNKPVESQNSLEDTITETLTVSKMEIDPVSSRATVQLEVPIIGDESTCNDEELNLSVSKSVFSQDSPDFNLEEYEDDEDCDNVAIDMYMFMNGTDDLL